MSEKRPCAGQGRSTCKTYHVISHTHWDREWYEPFEKLRVRLVRLIDNLLELVEAEPSYVFHLDAQTIVLEDYLEIKPHRKAFLKQAIRNGSILIGPRYVQNDLFLTGGEATIRNLLTGRHIANEFGAPSGRMVVYTPDHFGLPSQLPQISKGFGFDSVVFGRGRTCSAENGRKAEFIWKAPDGSTVLAVQMVGFYNNAQRFSADAHKALKFFELAAGKLEPFSVASHRLLMNGVDHLEAQEDLLEILPALQRSLGDSALIKQSSLYDYCAAVSEELSGAAVESGEMRDGCDRMILQGTLSSRVYLKVANIRCENFLARRLEPLNAIVSMLPFGASEYDRDLLDYLWRLLMRNHPHDSICGCSCDAVHRHMEDRFARIMEAGGHLMEEKLRLLGTHLSREGKSEGDFFIMAVNTLPFERSAMIEAIVDILSTEGWTAFKLTDAQGADLPYSIVSKELAERPLRSPINLPGRVLVDRFKIRFAGRIPAMGFSVFNVGRGKPQAQLKRMDFENARLKVVVNPDGRIDLTDKASGRKFADILHLEDTADYGDSYTYRPDPQSKVFSTRGLAPEISKLSDGETETAYKLSYELNLPASASFMERRRSSELVAVSVEITLTLQRDSPYLEVAFKIENHAKDHCLRAVVGTGIDSDMTQASSMFDVVERDKRVVRAKPDDDRQEPAFEFVKIQNERQGGMALLVEGLHAYENYRERSGEIGVTLLRANQYINGYYERPLDEAWTALENQCLRTVECRMAIMPGVFAGSPDAEAMAALEFLNPPLSHFGSWDARKFSGGRPCVQDSELSEVFYRNDPYERVRLPHAMSLCRVDDPGMAMTAMKRSEDGRGVVLRIYNLSAHPKSVKISFAHGIQRVDKCRIDETVLRRMAMVDSAVDVDAGPKEILTLKLS